MTSYLCKDIIEICYMSWCLYLNVETLFKEFALLLFDDSLDRDIVPLQISKSYPELVIVPRGTSDELVTKLADFRFGGRFPVLSYLNKRNKVSQSEFNSLLHSLNDIFTSCTLDD